MLQTPTQTPCHHCHCTGEVRICLCDGRSCCPRCGGHNLEICEVCRGDGFVVEWDHPGVNCGCLDCQNNYQDVTFKINNDVTMTLPRCEADKLYVQLGQLLMDCDLRNKEKF